MPLEIRDAQPSVCIRREAFERAGLDRARLDTVLTLTDDEFRVEHNLIVVGPLFGDAATTLIAELEARGLAYFDDFFELSGNWPAWLSVFAMHAR
jgi:8-oxo-dGTP pyrophosphatase MutT (NUDIX family)